MKVLSSWIYVLVMFVILASSAQAEWHSLFDGHSFEGWRASEYKDAWKIEDGCLVTRGPRSHLFYVGEVQGHIFKNFELRAEVKTEPGSNSGVFVHTTYQETDWPKQGYECQVINSYPQVEPGKYVERKMTGSIYGVRNTWKAPAIDNEWFDYRIVVQGKTLRTYINERLICEYTEPADAPSVGRVLAGGTIALQCHDPKSVVRFRNIKIKVLPDGLVTPGKALEDRVFDETLIKWSGKNMPLMDLHVHLKGGLTLDQALSHARRYGFTYGVAVNCGLQMTCENEAALQAFLKNYQKPPHSFLAMQAEGREWLELFSPELIAQFDYVFTDAMTWTNRNGKRMRLWIPAETEIGDPQDFMEQLVSNIQTIFSSEPVDIYVNPTYLPTALQDRYDELWTKDRMDRVIEVLNDNQVALEINARRKIPSQAFIERAKKAGVKFTFGTNNGGADDLGRMAYCIEMIKACGLKTNDLWFPQEKVKKKKPTVNPNWPDWRGPTGQGYSEAVNLPLHWSETKNVIWKTPIHDLGYSTPVVWGNQIWLTTATRKGETLYAVCLDLESGKVLYDITVFQPEKPQRVHRNNSYATPSAVIEEGFVYVHFGSHGTACIETETGSVVWRREDLECNHLQGPVSSPILFGDTLICPFEGTDVQFVVALDKKTGETVWRYDRPSELYEHVNPTYKRKSYYTPVMVDVEGRPQLITSGAMLVTGHDPHTGVELWRVRYRDDNPVSRVVSGKGLFFINSGGEPGKAHLLAVRQGGIGDVTGSHVVWLLDEDVPSESSPVLVNDLLYTLTDKGMLKCIEATTGKPVWSEQLNGDYGASLLYADQRIYLSNKEGQTTVIQPGRQFCVLAVNPLDGFLGASPAVAGKSLLLRTKTHVYRIGKSSD